MIAIAPVISVPDLQNWNVQVVPAAKFCLTTHVFQVVQAHIIFLLVIINALSVLSAVASAMPLHVMFAFQE